MKSEMADHQKQMWLSLIAMMEKHGMRDVNFAGFMADSAQANFNVVHLEGDTISCKSMMEWLRKVATLKVCTERRWNANFRS